MGPRNKMDDIEDLVVDAASHSASQRSTRGGSVLPKALRTGRCPGGASGDNIPGVGSVYIKTWGCAHNASDGEYMAGLLAEYGYSITPDPLSAELWLLNSCTVKGPSEDALLNAVRRGRELGRQVVVAGCVPQGQRDHPQLAGVSVIGVQQIDRVVEVVEETLQGNIVRLLGNRKVNGVQQGGAPLSLPKIRRNPLVEIIAVNTGCLNHCSYCKTKHARGSLRSYPPEEIVQRARQAFSEGVVEVWLTSEDLGAYGKDIGVTLPELLWQLIPIIPEPCMARLGMTNPPYIMEHLEEMVAVLSHPRVYSFLHIPVQSGSNAVLEDMKREYSIEDFRHLVDFLRQKVPNITIATDVICGFPTETTSDFAQTLALVQQYQFPSLFINQFYPRPGTSAARLKRLPTQEVKRRSREITALFHSYQPYHCRLGQTMCVLVTELSHDRQFLVGHNKFYEQVLVAKEEGLLGKCVAVKVHEVGKHFMKGEVYRDGRTRAVWPCLQKAGLNTWGRGTLRWLWVGFLVTMLSFLLFYPPQRDPIRAGAAEHLPQVRLASHGVTQPPGDAVSRGDRYKTLAAQYLAAVTGSSLGPSGSPEKKDSRVKRHVLVGNFPASREDKMATLTAPEARAKSLQGEVRSLFGGAFTCRIPSRYVDVSAVRDIPDHQEVMAEEEPAGRSLIVELLQYQRDVPDHQAARFHFAAVAEANGAEGEGQSSVVSVVQLGKEQVAMKQCSSGWALVGRQFVAKFNNQASDAHEVELYLALLRLPTHNTDVLITLNDPVGLRQTSSPGPPVGTAHREETQWVFENIFETLKLVDASILM